MQCEALLSSDKLNAMPNSTLDGQFELEQVLPAGNDVTRGDLNAMSSPNVEGKYESNVKQHSQWTI